jgi:nucleoside-diphosphate-sugar epimerase
MRVVILGASGNVGTALLRRLYEEPDVMVSAVARRIPQPHQEPYDRVRWYRCDIAAPAAADELVRIFAGADAVVHLAWKIQPSHDQRALYRTNVAGSAAVIEAVTRSGVPSLVYASSVGTYGPGPKDRPVDEGWPSSGVPGSSYSQHKASVEAMLNQMEREHPEVRVVRMRPGLIFQRDAGTEISRYFVGPFLPLRLLRFGRLPFVPSHPGLRLQAVHATDVADAYARALRADVRGAFNLAAEPVLSSELVAELMHARMVPVSGSVLRGLAAATWRARLQPVDPGWVDLALRAPVMSSARASRELDWEPTVDAVAALRELIDGIARHAHAQSPALSGDPRLAGRLGGALRGRLPGTGDPY